MYLYSLQVKGDSKIKKNIHFTQSSDVYAVYTRLGTTDYALLIVAHTTRERAVPVPCQVPSTTFWPRDVVSAFVHSVTTQRRTMFSPWLQWKVLALFMVMVRYSLQTHPLVREGAPHQETRNCQTEKNLSTRRHTGRLTVGRKLTSVSNTQATAVYSNVAFLSGQWRIGGK
jgi:hypothetical protein